MPRIQSRAGKRYFKVDSLECEQTKRLRRLGQTVAALKMTGWDRRVKSPPTKRFRPGDSTASGLRRKTVCPPSARPWVPRTALPFKYWTCSDQKSVGIVELTTSLARPRR